MTACTSPVRRRLGGTYRLISFAPSVVARSPIGYPVYIQSCLLLHSSIMGWLAEAELPTRPALEVKIR